MMDEDFLSQLIRRLKVSETDTFDIEVKESAVKLPSDISSTISAFSNNSGGIIILGLSEKNNFEVVKNFRAKEMANALANVCSDKVVPPVRADIEIINYQGNNVVVATIPKAERGDRPVFVREKGMYKGSFIRTFDGDRKLTEYEISKFVQERQQPTFDYELVEQANIDDLDEKLLEGIIARQRTLHPRFLSSQSDLEVAESIYIIRKGDDGQYHPTLAGLLAIGKFPQKYFPRLTVTFAAYPGTDKAQETGDGSTSVVKFLDSVKLIGPIPVLIADTLAAFERNSSRLGILDGAVRKDRLEYPPAALREAICNALMHRDYSPYARGTQVQVNLYADHLEILSPGGLFGNVTINTLDVRGYSSTRNQYLADILESTPFEGGFVAENRGTGIKLIRQQLKKYGLPDPIFTNNTVSFDIRFDKVAAFKRIDDPLDQIVEYISEHQPCNAKQISEAMDISRSTLTYRLKKLTDQGRVTRVEYKHRKSPDYIVSEADGE